MQKCPLGSKRQQHPESIMQSLFIKFWRSCAGLDIHDIHQLQVNRHIFHKSKVGEPLSHYAPELQMICCQKWAISINLCSRSYFCKAVAVKHLKSLFMGAAWWGGEDTGVGRNYSGWNMGGQGWGAGTPWSEGLSQPILANSDLNQGVFKSIENFGFVVGQKSSYQYWHLLEVCFQKHFLCLYV